MNTVPIREQEAFAGKLLHTPSGEKELLVLTNRSVGEIAQKVGFGDASNFSTRFAKSPAIPQKRTEAGGGGKVSRLIAAKHFLQKRCDHDRTAGAVRKCNNPLLLFYAKSDIITIIKDCFP